MKKSRGAISGEFKGWEKQYYGLWT